jgi:hypothetical protein
MITTNQPAIVVRLKSHQDRKWEQCLYFIFPNASPLNLQAYFYTAGTYTMKDGARYEHVYSTRNTLGPFRFVALFFLWPLSNDTAL